MSKKNRFYYSRKQDAVDEDMWGFTPRYTFVKTPNGYKQYSELCSIKGTRCNWADAELVYEADEMPEIIVHEAIPELIADLQHRLSNCIEPKFKVGQKIYVVGTESVEEVEYFGENIDGIITFEEGCRCGCTPDRYSVEKRGNVFATEEEAKAKLEELKK